MKTTIIKLLLVGLASIAIPQNTYSQIIEEIDKLIEIGNNKGTIDDDVLYMVAQRIYDACSSQIVKNESSRPSFSDALASSVIGRSVNSTSATNNKIYKELQNRKIHKRFIPYLQECKNIAIMQEVQMENEKKIAEMKAQEERKRGLENLNKYHAAINRTNGDGIISVEKRERDYKGEIPFSEYIKLRNRDDLIIKLIPTFIDEQFVLKQDLSQPKDTFGLYKNGDIYFINLRTGDCYTYYSMCDKMESLSYLAKYNSTKDFIYDPSYSLCELLNDELFNPMMPEKMCEALRDIEVYRTDKGDYDVIESVTVSREKDYKGNIKYKYKVGYKNESIVWNNNAFSIKWYEQLNKCIGKSFVYCEDDIHRWLYKETIPNVTIWTLEKVELGYLNSSDKKYSLVATIRSGQNIKRINAAESCMFITHKLTDLYPQNIDKYKKCLLPYDFVKTNVKKMPESVKNDIKRINKLNNAIGNLFKESLKDFYVGLSLSYFLGANPKAKLIKSTISGGKAIRVYHSNGYEYIFKDGVCTSANRF